MRALSSALLILPLIAHIGWANPDDLSQEVLETAHAVRQNRALLTRVPMYTCLETISREEQAPRQRKPRLVDVVQIDVGIGAGEEIYSWPGAGTFSSNSLAQLVGQGFLETGLFYGFAGNLFVADFAVFRPAGQQFLNGRNAIHFTYKVPSLQNAWKINWLGVQGEIGESGDFWVDPANLTLRRLKIIGSDFPPGVFLCALTITIDYETLAAGEDVALIPGRAQMDALEMTGRIRRDTIAFSGCRVFAAESKVSASPDSLAKNVEKYEAQRVALPPNLTLPITLGTEIRAGTARLAIHSRLVWTSEFGLATASPFRAELS